MKQGNQYIFKTKNKQGNQYISKFKQAREPVYFKIKTSKGTSIFQN